MQELLADCICGITANDSVRSSKDVYARLRKFGLLAFGEVLFDIQPNDFLAIKRLLPRMASDEIQRNWTGNCGAPLLMQSMDFVRAVTAAYVALTKRDISSANILDFGCGYGRIARLMYFFVDPDRLMGVDPWDKSIEICRDSGLGDNFRQSDYLPETLPYDGKFDFIYAFSVFTHLSERTTLKCLATLRKYITAKGMLCVTIRPIEYWAGQQPQDEQVTRAIEVHRRTGFAFQPHLREAVDGDVTYGDTSLTPEWLTRNCPEWRVAGIDTSYSDKNQLYLYLVPV